MARTDQNDILERLQDLLQADATFADASVVIGDASCLVNGSPPWALLYPGGLVQALGDAYGEYFVRARSFVEVWRPNEPDSGYADLVTALQAAVDVWNKYPTLNGLAQVVLTRVTDITDMIFLEPDVVGSDPEYAGFRVTGETVLRWTYDDEGEYT